MQQWCCPGQPGGGKTAAELLGKSPRGLRSTAEPFLGYYLIKKKKKDHSSQQSQPWLWGTAGKHGVSLPFRVFSGASACLGSLESPGAPWAPRACRVVRRCHKMSIRASQNKCPSKPVSGKGNSMGIILQKKRKKKFFLFQDHVGDFYCEGNPTSCEVWV